MPCRSPFHLHLPSSTRSRDQNEEVTGAGVCCFLGAAAAFTVTELDSLLKPFTDSNEAALWIDNEARVSNSGIIKFLSKEKKSGNAFFQQNTDVTRV